MKIRIYDAYRLGLITNEEYSELLASGRSPNSVYSEYDGGVVPPGFSNYAEGTTTSSIVSALDCYVTSFGKQSVSIFNTSPSNSMNATIEYYVSSILSDTVEQTIAPNNTYFIGTESSFQKIIVKVQDTVPGMHCTYKIGIEMS